MRNRIIKHVRVRAGDLLLHELNPRVHTDAQRRALQLLYDEIGFARSLLAYQLPDGRLKLIDGHLRADMTPDEELDVEVLDVSDAEARALLLTIDPLAQIAGYAQETLDKLRGIVEKDSPAIQPLWDILQAGAANAQKRLDETRASLPEQYLLLIYCRDEAEQIALLERFQKEGIRCSVKIA